MEGLPVARTKEQNERMIQRTKEKIMSSALKEFAYKGFAYTNIRGISKSAGMSTGLLYRHYNSKEELFHILIEKTVKSLSVSINSLAESKDNPKKAMTHMTEELLEDMVASEEVALYYLLMSRTLLEAQSISSIKNLIDKDLLLFEVTKSLIEEGQKQGDFKSGDPYQYSLYFYACIQGIANMRIFMREKFKLPEAEDVLAFLTN